MALKEKITKSMSVKLYAKDVAWVKNNIDRGIGTNLNKEIRDAFRLVVNAKKRLCSDESLVAKEVARELRKQDDDEGAA